MLWYYLGKTAVIEVMQVEIYLWPQKNFNPQKIDHKFIAAMNQLILK